ncbi:MAG: hypothetical protein KDC44_11300, partial [Phaeodactylibacter sp.]|nr:hypothetical protein [Phaeodactylibacter sp.]
MKNRATRTGAHPHLPKTHLFKLFALVCLILSMPGVPHAQTPADAEGDLQVLGGSLPVVQPQLQLRGTQALLEAGDAVEGDYLAEVKFTPDGSAVWVVNRSTNNISVFDWASQEILTTIDVGAYPTDVAFSDELALVPCLNSNEVYILNWMTFEQLAVLPTAAQPAKVKVSRDNELAVVGCDEADVAEVIDLQTLEVKYSIPDFPVYISKFAFITSNPRSSLYWSGFELSPDHAHLFNAAGSDGLLIYDLQSGDLVTTIPEVVNSAQVQLSGDGAYLLAVTTGNDGVVSKVDVAGLTLVNQTVVTGISLWSAYSPPAVNWTGSRVFVPCFPENTALVDTENMTFQTVGTGNSPDWVGQSSDYQYALASDYYQAVVDFETGAIVGSFSGYSIQNGAVSPANNRVVATDPLRYESLHFFEFETPTSFNWLGEQSSGSELEGYATYSLNFTPSGEYLTAVNALSSTL